VVVVTGAGDESLVVQVLRLGALDYVVKDDRYVETLPSVMRSAIEQHSSLQEQRRMAGQDTRRILYVERHAADVDLTMAHFAEVAAPFQLDVTSSSRDALDIVSRGGIDLVLIDLRMPDMSALEVLREMKRKALETPVVVITGKGDESAALAALKLGAYDYIVKRDNYLTQLPYAIENAIARARLLQAKRQLEAELIEREKAQESQRRLAAIVECSEDAIISKSLDGAITSWNSGAEALYGYTAAEVIGRRLSILMPAEASEDSPEVIERVTRGERIERYETARVARDGKRVDISVTLSPIRDEDGVVTGVAAIARDVTQQRRLEAQFIEAQKLESIGRLAGGIAHDFNNLLTVINGYSDSALSTLQADNGLFFPLAEIKRAGERASWLTRQLLAFSRKQAITPKVLDLNVVVRDLSRMLQRLIGERIEVVTKLEPGLPGVLADVGQIEQVVMNLAVNARDAMPEGGVVTIQTSKVEFDEQHSRRHVGTRAGAYVMLTVTDTGKGMDRATQSHIFEPFFTTKKEGEGTGLGLATVYGIVKQSGGFIDVESELDSGATFRLFFPVVAQRPGAGVDEAVPPPAVSAGSETVLIVEDETLVRMLLRTILKQAGYTVLEGQNGIDALAVFESHPGRIDLVIGDIIMPHMNGPELIERLTLLRPGLRYLYISGYTDDAILHSGALGSDAPFLQKPFTPSALLQKVREVLDA
jgi:two-component system cell cycle sensor histidine kinase/response regulator CckA